MTYSEILKLLEKGFTPEQVLSLFQAPIPDAPLEADYIISRLRDLQTLMKRSEQK